MGSAKTLNLLAVAHSYQSQGKRALILKPELDDRFGKQMVRSRTGLEKEADLLIGPTTRLSVEDLASVACVLVDEAQFVAPAFIDHLRQISRDFDIPVICYGLRTDFRTSLFDGARRLFELADAVEEIKSTCHYCTKKALFNMKLVNGEATLDGPSIQLGAEESYHPVCARCYDEKVRLAGVQKKRRAKINSTEELSLSQQMIQS